MVSPEGLRKLAGQPEGCPFKGFVAAVSSQRVGELAGLPVHGLRLLEAGQSGGCHVEGRSLGGEQRHPAEIAGIDGDFDAVAVAGREDLRVADPPVLRQGWEPDPGLGQDLGGIVGLDLGLRDHAGAQKTSLVRVQGILDEGRRLGRCFAVGDT